MKPYGIILPFAASLPAIRSKNDQFCTNLHLHKRSRLINMNIAVQYEHDGVHSPCCDLVSADLTGEKIWVSPNHVPTMTVQRKPQSCTALVYRPSSVEKLRLH